jgi:2-phospho-L-lactate guanylyltransferase
LIVAAVLYKGTSRAKTRLTDTLSPGDRAQLTAAWLERAMEALVDSPAIGDVAVVCPSSAIIPPLRIAPHVIHDSGDDINAAVRLAQHWATRRRARALLVLPSDLPAVAPVDIDAVTSQLVTPGGVLVPSKDGGTGALLLSPPNLIEPSFGPSSAQSHIDSISRSGSLRLVHRAGLALDVDSSADLGLAG